MKWKYAARSRPEGSGKENISCLSWIRIPTPRLYRSIFCLLTESVITMLYEHYTVELPMFVKLSL